MLISQELEEWLMKVEYPWALQGSTKAYSNERDAISNLKI